MHFINLILLIAASPLFFFVATALPVAGPENQLLYVSHCVDEQRFECTKFSYRRLDALFGRENMTLFRRGTETKRVTKNHVVWWKDPAFKLETTKTEEKPKSDTTPENGSTKSGTQTSDSDKKNGSVLGKPK